MSVFNLFLMIVFLIMKSEGVTEKNMSQRGSAVEDYEARMHDVENWVSRKELELASPQSRHFSQMTT